MSTVEDFKNAPVGATATRDDGLLAIKIGDGERRWLTPLGTYVYDDELAVLGYTLNPTVPTTVREALDLAWELAHEVKEGQVIPEGARYLSASNSGVKEYIAQYDVGITPGLAPTIRTLEPLQDTEPEWLDAPAILATMDGGSYQEVWLPMAGGHWKCTCCQQVRHWSDLRYVTPLYPKEEEGEWVSL